MAEETSYEVILSINGKHTPIAVWKDQRSSEVTLELVRYAYKQMVSWLSDAKERPKPASNAPYCKDHQIPMVWRKGKFGDFWSCPHRSEDGTYCKYRPSKN
jgi:hypothetical protein